MWDRKAERIAKYNIKKQNIPYKKTSKGNKIKDNESKQDRRTGVFRN